MTPSKPKNTPPTLKLDTAQVRKAKKNNKKGSGVTDGYRPHPEISNQNVWSTKQMKPGVKFREIGNVIQKHASAHGYSVVRRYCGHGIHRLFHTAPNVPHYAKNKAVGVMKAGNTFTIEPMINLGSYHDSQWPDDWTAVTSDGKVSAQFEQTLLVTDTGCEILTERSTKRPWFFDQLEQTYSNK